MLLNLSTTIGFRLELPFTAQQSPQTTVLVILSAQYEELIAQLQTSQEFLNAQMVEEFYRAAQYLYQTTPTQGNVLGKQYPYLSQTPAPDDVYLVELSLFEEDQRFAPHVNPLTRYDAFMDLLHTTASLKISERLRMEALETLEVYAR